MPLFGALQIGQIKNRPLSDFAIFLTKDNFGPKNPHFWPFSLTRYPLTIYQNYGE